MKKYKRVFAPVDNTRFDKSSLYALADETVFVCPIAMFDDIKDKPDLFEHYIAKALEDYDPENDLIADFGDSMIFAMMAFFLGMYVGQMTVARYNRRNSEYTIRVVDENTQEWKIWL